MTNEFDKPAAHPSPASGITKGELFSAMILMAVMPEENWTAAARADYVVGMAEELIAALERRRAALGEGGV